MRQFFKQLQRKRLQLRHWCTCALHLYARIFQFLTIELIDSTFTGSRDVFTKSGHKLRPGWLCAQLLHLQYRSPGLLNKCVCTCSALAVCVPSSRCTITIFHYRLLCTNCKQLCSVCEASFPKSSSVSLRRLHALVSPLCDRNPSDSPAHGMGNDAASQHPSTLPDFSHRRRMLHGTTLRPPTSVACLRYCLTRSSACLANLSSWRVL